MRVLITTPNFGAQSDEPWDVLAAAGVEVVRPRGIHPLDREAFATEAAGCDAAIVGLDDVSGAAAAVPGLRVIAKHGVGVDNIDLDAARAAGVTVVNAPGSNSDGVADLTLGLILASARHLVEAHASCRAGEWRRFPGMELSGKTLAVLGFGRIGRGVAHRAAAFGMRVVAYDPFVDDADLPAGVTGADLDDALRVADVVTLHLPGGDGVLLNRRRLASLRAGAIVVNAARGGLLDEEALVELLHSGHLGAAALDALSVEPLPHDSPLRGAPRLLLTPHIGAQTDNANRAMGVSVATDVVRVLRGDAPHHPVDAI